MNSLENCIKIHKFLVTLNIKYISIYEFTLSKKQLFITDIYPSKNTYHCSQEQFSHKF